MDSIEAIKNGIAEKISELGYEAQYKLSEIVVERNDGRIFTINILDGAIVRVTPGSINTEEPMSVFIPMEVKLPLEDPNLMDKIIDILSGKRPSGAIATFDIKRLTNGKNLREDERQEGEIMVEHYTGRQLDSGKHKPEEE